MKAAAELNLIGQAPASETGRAAPQAGARPHFLYLDGLRGVSALYVVVSHVFTLIARRHGSAQLGLGWHALYSCFSWGRGAVAVFIVLSGYCLMLPVSRDGPAGELRGGVRTFLLRRSKRILPPYYFALLASLALLLAVPSTRHYAAAAYPLLKPSVLISHLLLAHNLRPWWEYKVNGALWSVATEWQIYFVFALLLLPIRRRLGILAAILAATALGLAPHFLLRGKLDGACFQYIGLFALGMLASELNFSPQASFVALRQRPLPWGALAAGFAALFALAYHALGAGRPLLLDELDGFAAASLIVWCANTAKSGRVNRVAALLSCKPVYFLGVISYSLYLIHDPLLYSLESALLSRGCSIAATFILLLAAVPLVVAVAFVFHLAFERPFLNTKTPL